MKIAGIICEYNPFHSGHMYQIQQVRRVTGAQGVVCVMSGSFVQRGEPAMLDKYVRAEAAVRCGADLVLELPVTAAIDSAEGFARGGVRLLNDLGCVDYLAFGSESGDMSALEKVTDTLLCPEFSSIIRTELDKGISFAAARGQAAAKLDSNAAGILGQPNDILAVEYLKALRRFESTMEPVAIRRIGPGHNGETFQGYASASEIRRRMRSGETWVEYVPDTAKGLFQRELEEGKAYSFANAERAVLYRLKTMTNDEFDDLPFASEGLNVRLQRYARSLGSTTEIIDAVKTKRYAHSRIRRVMLCAFLGMTEEKMQLWPGYARVLAFNSQGREIIRKSELPILNNSGQIRDMPQEDRRYFDLEAHCEDLLTLCLPESITPEYGRAWRERARMVENHI